MKLIEEFKKFAMRGNVIDLAVGVIVGGAFGKITTSLVNDILMPPIGLLVGGVDFSALSIVLKDGETPVVIGYGLFLNALLNFLIIAFAVFMMVRTINKMTEKPTPAPAPVTTRECPECLSSIPLKAKRCSFCASVVPA